MKAIILGLAIFFIIGINGPSFAEEPNNPKRTDVMPVGRIGGDEKMHPVVDGARIGMPLDDTTDTTSIDELKGPPNGMEFYGMCDKDGKCSFILVTYGKKGDASGLREGNIKGETIMEGIDKGEEKGVESEK